MKILKNNLITTSLVASFVFVALGLTGSNFAHAATAPALGVADTFGILAHTYTHNYSGTVIVGDLGYTTLLGTGTSTVVGTTHVADSIYTQAGIDQGVALTALNSQLPCTANLPAGVNLAMDTTHGSIGVYTPGVYCVAGNATIGGSFTLSGSGTYIFRINGILTTASFSHINVEKGASACGVFWTTIPGPVLSSFGIDSFFVGTFIDPSGVIINDAVTWSGRALVFGGSVSTGYYDKVTIPDMSACTLPPPPPPPPPAQAILHIIKHVVNDNGGTKTASDFTLHVKGSSSFGLSDVVGSPAVGVETPGTAYILDAGSYVVNENNSTGYTAMFDGDCNAAGHVTLNSGDEKTCIITNDDVYVVPPFTPPPPILIPTTTIPVTIPTTTPPSTPTTTQPYVPTSTPPTPPLVCDICSKLTYDVYIVNPNKSERHTGTAWVRVTDRKNGIKRYSFEDKTLDPNDSNYDYNDAIVDVDFRDCKHVKFVFVSSDAAWKHKIRIKVSIDGVKQSDTLVANDSKAVVGTSKIVNATTKIKAGVGCPSAASLRAICKRNAKTKAKMAACNL